MTEDESTLEFFPGAFRENIRRAMVDLDALRDLSIEIKDMNLLDRITNLQADLKNLESQGYRVVSELIYRLKETRPCQATKEVDD